MSKSGIKIVQCSGGELMYIFEWNDEIITGFDNIDKQHRELYNRINDFFNATNRNQEKKIMDDMMHYLNGFFVEHFTDEEKIHSEGKFPYFEAHAKAHEKILKDLNEIDQLYKQEGYSEKLEIKLYNLLIRDMLTQMKEFDIPLARFIKEKH